MDISNLFKKSADKVNKTKDPVCGMTVNLATTQYKTTRKGKVYGFCSASCQETFAQEQIKKTKI